MKIRLPILALAIPAMLASATMAQETRISIHSSLKAPPCTTISKTAAARPGGPESVEYRCSGAAGWSVRVARQGDLVTAAFEPPGTGKTRPQVAAIFEIGPEVEWRGFRRPSGFAVDSAVVRFAVGRSDGGSLLAVIAVLAVSDGRMCVVTLLDANGHVGATGEARRIADAQPLDCPAGGPRVAGAETAAIRAALERLRQFAR